METILEKLKPHKGKIVAVLLAALVGLTGYLSPDARQAVLKAFDTAPVASNAAPVDSSR